jgi:hypothetical protein
LQLFPNGFRTLWRSTITLGEQVHPQPLEACMPNRNELIRTPADQMTFKKWAIGAAIFYGSVAAIAACFLIARQQHIPVSMDPGPSLVVSSIAPGSADIVPQQIWP